MVHRKSHYSLQFRILPNDLRKKIWEENNTSRKKFRSTNQACHYWQYQLCDDDCDCDNEVEDIDCTVVPPHRLKHIALLAQYGNRTQDKVTGLAWSNDTVAVDTLRHIPELQDRDVKKGSDNEIGVQTPNWKKLEKAESEQELLNLNKRLSLTSILGVEAQTTRPGLPHSIHPETSHSVHPETSHSVRPETSHSVRPETSHSVRPETSHSVRPETSHSVRPETSHSVQSARIHKLTRSSRRAYFEDKLAPFVPYGWNDVTFSVGEKKTYNVQAPESQVKVHALQEGKRRRECIKKYLEEEAENTKQAMKASGVNLAINHGSIWRTEYQENFTPSKLKNSNDERGRRLRSSSANKIAWTNKEVQ